MKINYTDSSVMLPINSIPVGRTFFAPRSSKREQGLYMRVDGESGLIKNKYQMSYAVNLATGQLREFASYTGVEPTNAEVTFP